jgi:hypothetical protein
MSARTAKNERKHFKNFRDHVQIKVWRGDQHELLRINDKKIKSLIVMNIPTYGGARCWVRDPLPLDPAAVVVASMAP